MKEYPRHFCGGDFFVTPAAKKVIKTYIKLHNSKKVIKTYITYSHGKTNTSIVFENRKEIIEMNWKKVHVT